jgi:hypothetical protein
MWGYVYITIAKFECIPLRFSEILFAITCSGRKIDGTAFGQYNITVHPRGQMFGNSNGKTVRYQHGCNINYDVKGIKISRIECRNPAFIRMLNTAPQVTKVEFELKKGKTTTDFKKTRAAKKVFKNRYR